MNESTNESPNQKCVCRWCPVLPVVNGQCPVSTVFSCDTGTQDRRNRAGLREGKQVRTAPTTIGRSCTFSMLWGGEGIYCPFTHNAKRLRPPSEQLHNPFSPQSYITVGLKGCQSALYLVDWWTRDQSVNLYAWVSILIVKRVKKSLCLYDFEIMFCSLLSMTGRIYISDNQYFWSVLCCCCYYVHV